MYTRYFGLNEKPFTLTPNPRFIFLSKQHREAFAHLLYGINNRHGFIELIGEVGTGKTTVLRTLLNQLQERNYRIALIFNPCMTAVELLRNISQEYGLETTGVGSNELLSGLNSFLLKENAGGRTVVLVIDEAQNLQPGVLEQLRLISNLETENEKLIQIILAGQPELENVLKQHNLRQLNQRIAVRCRLGTMGQAETGAYIRHRLKRAGATTGVSFSSLAVSLVHLSSRGVPRMVNILCDRALLTAYAHGSRTVSSLIILRAMNELHGVSRRRFALFHLTVLLLSVSMLGLMAGRTLPEVVSSQEPSLPDMVSLPLPERAGDAEEAVPRPVRPGTAVAEFPPSPGETAQVRRLERTLANQSPNDVHIAAFNGLMSRWQANPIRLFRGTLSVPGTFAELAAKRNLRCTVFQGSLDDAIRFDIPFLVSTRASGEKGRYYLAVTAARGKALTVSPSLMNGRTIGRSDLAQVVDGTYYLLWHDSAHIPNSLTPGERRHELRALQRLLKQAGFYHKVVDGKYNTATISAVRQFQLSWGIPVNDSGGELTMALLSRYDKGQMAPSLNGI